MVKIYGMIWLAVALLMLVLFVTGTLTLTLIVAFGFVIFGLVFMGMMGVLPASIAHPAAPKPAVARKQTETNKDRGRVHHAHGSVHA